MGHHVAPKPKAPPSLRQIFGAALDLPRLMPKSSGYEGNQWVLQYRIPSLYHLDWSPVGALLYCRDEGLNVPLHTEHQILGAISRTGIDLRVYLSDAERRWSALGLLVDTTGWSQT
jgi:hypothetical protein